MRGYGFKLLRVLAGVPVLVGVVLYMRREMWVRDASEVKAQAALCCVAALLVVSGVLGSARLFSRRWRGLPDEVGWGAGLLFFLLTLAVSIPVGLSTAFVGRVMNVRTAPEFSVMGDDAWSVYEAMATTAFDDFAGVLARGYGLAAQ